MKNMWQRLRFFFIRDLWTINLSPLGRLKAILIQILRFLAVLFKDIMEGRITLWAMSLVYTTLLSFVPLLAVAFSVLKAFGVHNKIEPFLFNLLSPLGPKGGEFTHNIVQFVNNMRVGVLGVVGLATLIYTVISLVQKVEESFNQIWRVRNLRTIVRRFSDYLSVILVGPVLVVAALAVTATILSTSLIRQVLSIEPIGTIVYYTGEIIPFVLVCGAFTFVYTFLPNTKVKLTSGLVGGVIAGILWETIGWAFGSFIVNSSRYAAIYSGFAIVIFFMIWLYLSWLILLIGAEISFYHQNPQLLTIQGLFRPPDARILEGTALSIMFLLGCHFYHNKPPWSASALVYRLGLSMEPIEEIMLALERKHLIIRISDQPPAYVPARDMETIKLREIYEAVRPAGTVEGGFERRKIASIEEIDAIMGNVDAAIANALDEKTLKDIVLSAKGNRSPEECA